MITLKSGGKKVFIIMVWCVSHLHCQQGEVKHGPEEQIKASGRSRYRLLDPLQLFGRVCLLKRVGDNTFFRGGSAGGSGLTGPRQHLLKHAGTLCGAGGVCGDGGVPGGRWRWSAYLCVGDNRLIRKMSQTVNDEIRLVQTANSPFSLR